VFVVIIVNIIGMKLVRMKIPATTRRTMAVVPEIWFAKYRPAITRAASILTTLSMVPMFFFIGWIFG
jgi:hypothetical protein